MEQQNEEILALERAALALWCQGNPSGFLEISAPDVTYFDPFVEHRLDGLEDLTRYYEGLRGQISASRWEIVAPKVQRAGDVAVLTFQFHSWGSSGEALRWNCTEVYRRAAGRWSIIQTNWSFASAGKAA